MSIAGTLLLGVLIGWLASLVARSEGRQGLILHIGAGVIGALIGFAALHLPGAALGALLILLLFELARRRHGAG